MLGLEHHGFISARALLLELDQDVDACLTEDPCPDDINSNATRIARDLETSLSLLPGFNKACDAARSFASSVTRPVYSRELQGGKNFTLSLLGIHPESRIPVHDHPGMLALLYVIEGRVHAPQYDIVGHRERHAFVELASRSENVLEIGDAVVAMRATGNLHSLQALDNNAVCLTLHLHLQQEREPRSWYFPLASNQYESSSALWYRKQDKEISNGI